MYFKVCINVQVNGTYTNSSESTLTMSMTKGYGNEKAEHSIWNPVSTVSVLSCAYCHHAHTHPSPPSK